MPRFYRGGILWERERPYRIEWTTTGRESLAVVNIKNKYKTSYKIKKGEFIAYGDIKTVKQGEEYYNPNGFLKCIIKRLIGDQCAVEYCRGEIIYED